jgi:hypothetical protein
MACLGGASCDAGKNAIAVEPTRTGLLQFT